MANGTTHVSRDPDDHSEVSFESKLKSVKHMAGICEKAAQFSFTMLVVVVVLWCVVFAKEGPRTSSLSLALDIQRIPLRDSAETFQARLHHLHQGWYPANRTDRTHAHDLLIRSEIGHGIGEFLCRREVYRSFASQLGIIKTLTGRSAPSPWIEWVENRLSPFSSHDVEGYRDAKKHRKHMEEIRQSFARYPCNTPVWAFSSGARRLLAELLLTTNQQDGTHSCQRFSWFHGELGNPSSKVAEVYGPIIDEILALQGEDAVRCRIRNIHTALVKFVRAFDERGTIPRKRLQYLHDTGATASPPSPYFTRMEL